MTAGRGPGSAGAVSASSMGSGGRWRAPVLDFDYMQRVRPRISADLSLMPPSFDAGKLTHVGRAFLGYWLGVRGDALVPDPSVINPADIGELVPYVRYGVLEDEDTLVFRVWGSAITAMGGDLTGVNVFDLVAPEARDEEKWRAHAVCHTPCGIHVVREGQQDDGPPFLYETMSLPVGPDREGRYRMIGTVSILNGVDGWDIRTADNMIHDKGRASFFDIGAGVPAARGPVTE